MKRGDLVTVAFQGDYGKPRPALVIQADEVLEHSSITVLPISTDFSKPASFRIEVEPSTSNGLRQRSRVMTDKPARCPGRRSARS